MRKYVYILAALVLGISSLSAQTNLQTVQLKGRVLDSTDLPMAATDVKVYRDDKVVAEGKTNAVGDFDIAVAPGEYRVEVSAPDFDTSNQTVRVVAGMPALSVRLTLKAVDTVIDVSGNQNEIGVDSESSLTTDTIMGDALLDLPDNEEDLLAYLEQLAAARGIVDGELNIRVDGFELSQLPNRAEIQEIRIINNSFSAESNSSGPRIEIITRPGTGFWTGNLGLTFADESLNAAAPLTGRKPASQTRNFNGQIRGPIIPGRITATMGLQNNERESEGSAIRAVGVNGPVNEGVTSITKNRRFTFGPTLNITSTNTLTANFNYTDNRTQNGGVGGFNLPERASNNKSNSWNLQLTERMTLSPRFTNEIRFQANRSSSGSNPLTDGVAINVADAFNGGGATNRSSNSSRNFMITDQVRFQVGRTLQFTAAIQADYRKTHSDSQNNYNGTFTFASLHDYCYATNFVGSNCALTQQIVNDAIANGTTPTFSSGFGQPIAITGVPTRYTQVTGNPILDVSQAEFSSFLQGEWRANPRMQVSFGARYQVQQHLRDFNNIAPTAGVAYQLNTNQTWRTIIRAGARMNYSVFSMGNWEQLLRNDGQARQYTIEILSPSFPDPFAAGSSSSTTPQANSIRVRTEDYVAPYTIQPSIAWEQSLPRRMTFNVNFQMNRGVHQNRSRNINAPYPGTPLPDDILALLNFNNAGCSAFGYSSNSPDCSALVAAKRAEGRAIIDPMRPFFPYIGNITQMESTGTSFSKNLSFQFRTQNVPVLWGKVQIGGNLTWSMNWANDDSGTPMNSYDVASEWGRSSQDQRHRISSNLNVRLPRNMQFTINPGWSSGRPYNITLGSDRNGDSSNNDRPAGFTKNAGTGPSNFSTLNFRFTKTFIFAANQPAPTPRAYAEPQRGGGGFGGGGGGGGFGGGGGGFGGQGGGRGQQGRQVQFTISVNNLFNSTTRTGVSGVMSSPLFGQLTGGGQGRTIQLGLNTNLGRLF
jgi:hypothetical protein